MPSAPAAGTTRRRAAARTNRATMLARGAGDVPMGGLIGGDWEIRRLPLNDFGSHRRTPEKTFRNAALAGQRGTAERRSSDHVPGAQLLLNTLDGDTVWTHSTQGQKRRARTSQEVVRLLRGPTHLPEKSSRVCLSLRGCGMMSAGRERIRCG